ncbi:putative gustatory receptor 28b isoform X1 [Ischnura elegans]|uniref:putative gustatory receptor 28b isoform X1 n=1 Tax=Ischnura elegans TaxID=197161 RepID=UPI001ED8B772|nr:putative gustatory receptor 28b isoform X1 [Ischnura elegans]XP_046382417.1 putative gustatory receptor 28b isoform X1 [Ischnura elegans]
MKVKSPDAAPDVHRTPLDSNEDHSDEVMSSWSLLHLVEECTLCHSSLMEEIGRANSLFGPSMLSTVISAFLDLVHSGYHICNSQLISPLELVRTPVSNGVTALIHFLLLCWSTGSAISESQTIGVNLVKQLGRGVDDVMKREIHFFINQLSHKKVEFSVLGVFHVDMELILTMSQVVASYLVLLLQFKP